MHPGEGVFGNPELKKKEALLPSDQFAELPKEERLRLTQEMMDRHDDMPRGVLEANAEQVQTMLGVMEVRRRNLLNDHLLSPEGVFAKGAREKLVQEGIEEDQLDFIAESQRLETNLDYWCHELKQEGMLTEDGEMSRGHWQELREGNFSEELLRKIQDHQRAIKGLPPRRQLMPLPPEATANFNMTKKPD